MLSPAFSKGSDMILTHIISRPNVQALGCAICFASLAFDKSQKPPLTSALESRRTSSYFPLVLPLVLSHKC